MSEIASRPDEDPADATGQRSGSPCFGVDPAALLADPRLLALSPADVGGLFLLWMHAWSVGGLVPAQDPALAGLTRLADGWPGSALRANMGQFFESAPDRTYLRAIDLRDPPQRRGDGRATAQRALLEVDRAL